MGTVRVSRKIDAPVDAAFAAATDFARLADYVPGILSVELLSDQATGIGARFRETRTMFGREATEEMTVTQCDPPHGFTLESHSCGCLMTTTHRFTPDEAGTLVELELTPRPESLGARVMMTLMAPLTMLMTPKMRKLIAADLDAVAAEAARRAEQPEE